MAQMHLEHERRINAVNARVAEVSAQVSMVAETLEQIKKGNIPEGYIGYRQLAAKCGLTEAKCRNLVNAYRIPTDTHEFFNSRWFACPTLHCGLSPLPESLQAGYVGGRTTQQTLVSSEDGAVSGNPSSFTGNPKR